MNSSFPAPTLTRLVSLSSRPCHSAPWPHSRVTAGLSHTCNSSIRRQSNTFSNNKYQDLDHQVHKISKSYPDFMATDFCHNFSLLTIDCFIFIGAPFSYHNPALTASPYSTLPRRPGGPQGPQASPARAFNQNSPLSLEMGNTGKQ